MSKQIVKNSSELGREILREQCSTDKKMPLLQFATGDLSRDELEIRDWILPLNRSNGQLCIMFPSGNGGHYVRYRPRCGLKVVYSGPHGAEIRPANLDHENLKQLIERADWIEIIAYEETPYADVEVTGDA